MLSTRLTLVVTGPTVVQESNQNAQATGAPTISGTAQVGQTLTADASGISDSDGLSNATFSYQWIRDNGSTDFEIQDATGTIYTLVDADEGKTIKVQVSFTDDAENEETLTSAATAVVAARPNNQATGAPTITGTAQAGETLTADTSGITDADGLTNASFTYQWVSNDGSADADIQDATDSTYPLSDDDTGKTVKVRVTFTDDAGNGEALTSEATAAVIARPNSPATGQPTISGTAQAGQALTADISSIEDDDGLTNATFSYQWIWNDGTTDADIQDATDSTYPLSDDDVGKTVKVRATFTDDAGNGETLTSAATDAVQPAPEPLTASLSGAPASHDGETAFTFELRFSEEFPISYRKLRDHAFAVSGGTVQKAERVTKGSNLRWRITVRPDGGGQVAITLPETTGCEGEAAICTGDGRMLSNRTALTVSGPGQ